MRRKRGRRAARSNSLQCGLTPGFAGCCDRRTCKETRVKSGLFCCNYGASFRLENIGYISIFFFSFLFEPFAPALSLRVEGFQPGSPCVPPR